MKYLEGLEIDKFAKTSVVCNPHFQISRGRWGTHKKCTFAGQMTFSNGKTSDNPGDLF